MKEAKINATMTGFIIAMILIAMFGTIFGVMVSQLNEEYSMSGNNSFEKYGDYTGELVNATEDIRDASNIKQETGILDILGGYFSAGYSALKISLVSFSMFDSMLDDAETDVPQLSLITPYIWMIIAILIFVGIVITVLVKMRI